MTNTELFKIRKLKGGWWRPKYLKTVMIIAFVIHCFCLIQAFQQKKHVSIKKVRDQDNNWKILFEPHSALGKKSGNDSDPFVDLNDARERTQSWLVAMNNLSPAALSTLKRELDKRVDTAKIKINGTGSLSLDAKKIKHDLLEMFSEELQESEKDMMNAIDGLRRSLTSDFRNPAELRQNSKHRLDFLRIATMKEEQSYNKLKDIEDIIKNHAAHINNTGILDDLLHEVAMAADQLEAKIEDHIVNNNIPSGGQIEAVVHFRENENGDIDYQNGDSDDDIDIGDVLVDSQNNKYVLSKPKDSTSPLIDHHLVMDIIMVLLICLPFGMLCEKIGLPTLFGYVMTGVLLGPSGLNVLKSMVQVETIGEFGVFFILFFAGLEFSPDKIRKVWRIAIQGPTIIMLVMIYVGITIGSVVLKNVPLKECAFISACLSLSSTPLVMKFLQSNEKSRHKPICKDDSPESQCGQYLLGMLVMQDVQLGVIIALLPAFGENDGDNSRDVIWKSIKILLETIASFIVVLGVCFIFVRFLVSPLFRILHNFSKEIELLGQLAVMFIMLLTTQSLGISMELGCFLGGFVIASVSSTSHRMNSETIAEDIDQKLSPLRDLFSIIFFTTIGFHVFPTFVLVELTILLWMTFVVVATKFAISVIVLRFLLPPGNQHIKWLISSGLAQISEFCFVLSSRARRLRIISREVYLLILSTTTLSLLLAPIMWRLSIWSFHNSKRRSSSVNHL